LGTVTKGSAWQATCRDFFDATGIHISAADSLGKAVKRAPTRVEICKLVMSTPDGKRLCRSCHGVSLAKTSKLSEPTIGSCAVGLNHFVAPLIVNRTICGYLVGAAFILTTSDRTAVIRGLQKVGIDGPTARRAAAKVFRWPPKQATAVANLITEQISLQLANNYNQGMLDKRVMELTRLYEAGKVFNSTLDLDQLVELTMDLALEVLPAEGGSVMLVDDSGKSLRIKAARGISSEVKTSTVIPLGRGVAGWVAKHGQPLLLKGDVHDPRFQSLAPRPVIHSAISVPLRVEGKTIGVLNVNNTSAAPALTEDDMTVLRLFAERASMAIENAKLYRIANERIAELSHLNELGKALNSTLNVREIVELACNVLDKSIDFTAGGICLGGGRKRLYLVVPRQVSESQLKRLTAEITGTKTAAQAVKAGYEISVLLGKQNVAKSSSRRRLQSRLEIPLQVKDDQIGSIFVVSTKRNAFDENHVRAVNMLASQVAVSLENAQLYESLRDNYAATIAALSATIDAKDHYTRGHSDRVMEYAMSIASALGLPEDAVETARFAGLLHDIGKIGVSEAILLKPSKLSSEEFELIKTHSVLGASIVEQIDFLNKLTPIILHHHERYGGGGYPDGLYGDDIPLLARVLSVADSYEAMTSERAYRPALTREQAMSELKRCAGEQFDPMIVEVFLDLLKSGTDKPHVTTTASLKPMPEKAKAG
jgi:putative nucleotidyltransferase with HDIG domain